MKLSARINSLRAIVASAALLACSSAFAGGSLTMVGEPGDYISQGLSYSYTDGVSGSASSDNSVISISVYSGNDWWYVDLAAPAGQQLVPGTYTGATRYPFQNPTDPGLAVYGNGRGCNENFGTFTIKSVSYGAFGYLTHLEADFEQHCEYLGAPGLFGTVVINNPPPPAPLDFAVSANGNGEVVKLSGVATVHGTVQCSANTTAQVYGTLSQRSGRKSLAQGSYSVNVPCGPTASTWSANVSSQSSIPFAQGQAQNDINAGAWDPNYGGQINKSLSTVVNLSAVKRTVTAKSGAKLRY